MTNEELVKKIDAALDDIAHYIGYTSHHVSEEKSKDIFKSLTKARQALTALKSEQVDVELFRKIEGDYIPTGKREREYAAYGWNKCIDHLKQHQGKTIA